MQVEREKGATPEYSGERVSNTWVTCPMVGDNIPKGVLIPHETPGALASAVKGGLSQKPSPSDGPAAH